MIEITQLGLFKSENLEEQAKYSIILKASRLLIS